jgi:hypothetical protein
MRTRFFGTAAGLLLVAGLLFGVPAALAQPSNDDFDAATVISALPFSDALDMTTATLAADDPSDHCADPLGATVWYTLTPSKDMPVAFDTFGSNFLSSIAVYTGSRGALTPLACSSLGTNSLGLNAAAGTTYHVMIASNIYYGTGSLLQFRARQGLTVESFTINSAAKVNTASGVATISGNATCDQNATATVSGTLRQRINRVTVMSGSFSLETPCSSGGVPWSTTVIADNGPFGGGKAGADATATACLDGIVCTSKTTTKTVTLRGGH